MSRAKQYPKKILARATGDEHQRVTTRARAAGLSVSRFLIECALTIEVANSEDRSQRERAIREIRRVGNNLKGCSPTQLTDRNCGPPRGRSGSYCRPGSPGNDGRFVEAPVSYGSSVSQAKCWPARI